MKFTFLKQAVLTFMLLSCCSLSHAQLNGTYTINSAQPTSGNNYRTFRAFASALNTLGVNGPVVANVVAGSGPYIDSASIKIKRITGASATNTIRINGNGNWVQYVTPQPIADMNANDLISYAIIWLDSVQYLHIDSLNVKLMPTTIIPHYMQIASGIIFNNGGYYDSVTRCTIDMTDYNRIRTDSLYIIYGNPPSMGIGCLPPIISATGGPNPDCAPQSYSYFGGNTIKGMPHCLMTGPDVGVAMGIVDGIQIYGKINNNIIENNNVQDFEHGGIRLFSRYNYKSKGNIVRNNIILKTHALNLSNLGGTASGITVANFNASPLTDSFINMAGTTVTGNRVYINANYSRGFYSILLSNIVGTADSPILVANNAVYYKDTTYNTANPLSYAKEDYYGITYFMPRPASYTNIYHNTVSFDVPINDTFPAYGIWVNCTYPNTAQVSTTNIKNNLVTITRGTTRDKFGFNYTKSVNAQHNNFYVNSTQPGSQYYGKIGTTSYTGLTAFQTANPTLEVGSQTLNPQFTNMAAGNFIPTNCDFFGTGENLTATVPVDINGQSRCAYPTPGAFEHYWATIDITTMDGDDGNKSICTGTPITFIANATGTATPHYRWKKNGLPVGTDSVHYTDNALANGDVISCLLGCSTSGVLAVSDSITMTVFPSPAPVVGPISGPDYVCKGATITLTDTTVGGVWTTSAGAIATVGSATGVVTGVDIGNANIAYTKTNNYGCATKVSKMVTVKPLPEPVITILGNTLFTGIYNSYQWYLNNQSIPGATNQFYNVTAPGNYSVKVTNGDGCSGTSAVAQTTGIHDHQLHDLVSIYPNPTSDMVYINSPVPVDIMLRSVDGRTISEIKNATSISLKMLSDGIYLLHIFDKKGKLIKVEKTIKQHRL